MLIHLSLVYRYFISQQQRLYDLKSLKYFLSGPSQKKFANSWPIASFLMNTQGGQETSPAHRVHHLSVRRRSEESAVLCGQCYQRRARKLSVEWARGTAPTRL